MMYQIKRPETAFSVLRQKKPRQHNTNHLAFIRSLPCVICGKRPCDPAHLRSANPRYGKRATGMAEKPSDKWTVPLCRQHHDDQHSMNELVWWANQGIDPHMLALSLYGASGDEEMAAQIITQARAA